ncbi:3-keto-5-aminohexanoate cleavage protein [Roseospirillum parvum]|uniref:Uncharacterized conserved protein, DUF849 family n=1 Tax=Roseospirillum parvum TaxID=83401 RepID=A0A1G7WLF3_9PROT|nr:3-keto-5-aminohexanoate cleavage protein [Roseospirillum parvum]SDG72752.1 Uncharacterized conserved protein, DUF849 family [Roseospirillum parvum]
MSDVMPGLTVAVAPNGARRGLEDHPAIPLTPAGLAEVAGACLRAGAAMLHLHVRDREGRHLLDAEAYLEAIRAVRRVVGDEMVLQITTEAVGMYQRAAQMAVVRGVRPEAVSLALGELLPEGADPAPVAAFLRELAEDGALVQYILYRPDEVARLAGLVADGVIPEVRPRALYVLGKYAGDLTARPADLLGFLAARPTPPPGDWMICAFGPLEGACAATAAALGGDVRLGFENNLLLADGRLAPDNAALVAQMVAAAPLCGRRLATAAEVRAGWRLG